MHKFYRNYLSADEHERIDRLELFDEIEEWQSKCAHYILLFGLRTSSTICEHWFDKMNRDFQSIVYSRKNDPLNSIEIENKLNLNFEPYPTVINYAQRFGHQSVLINEKFVWTIGGFGTVDGRHRRLKTIEVLNLENGEIQRLDNHALGLSIFFSREIEIQWIRVCLGEFVFHTCHVDGEKIIVLFGRKSPGTLNDCCSIDFNCKLKQISFEQTEILCLTIFSSRSFGNFEYRTNSN